MAFINRIRKTRSLSVADREQVASIAKTRPAVDLEINFDYNSASVSPQAEPQLHSLGKALTSAELAGSVFMLGGHTDAKGTDGYNLSLSERRAETVKKFLMENYKISGREPRVGRLRRDRPEEQDRSGRGRKPPRADRQHGQDTKRRANKPWP